MRLTGLNIEKPRQALSNDKIAPIMDFLKENYEIRINSFDPSMLYITSLKKKYDYSITFDDISLHLLSSGIIHSESTLKKIIKSHNLIETFNPIDDYFKRLDKFKGKSQINMLCQFLKARDFEDKANKLNYYQDRLKNLLKKWLVACLACYKGAYINPVALGFIQPDEGTGKTYFFNWILPEDLKGFFVEYIPDKMNIYDLFARKFLILFDELIGINNRSAETFKNVMQSSVLPIKHRNELFSQNLTRIGSACFTTNMNQEKGGFLTENLGTRRFACIELDEISHVYSKQIDKNQLWAEVLYLFNNGFDYVFNMEDFREFKEYNKKYIKESKAINILSMYYEIPANGHGSWKQPSDILKDLVKRRRIGKNDNISEVKIGKALQELGFKKKSRRLEIGPRHAYYVKEV